MRSPAVVTAVISSLLLSFVVASAQEKALPSLRQYTPEQRWTRLAIFYFNLNLGALGYAKSVGRTADDLAQYYVKLTAPSLGWAKSGSPMKIFRGIRSDITAFPNGKCELIDSLENKVIGRYQRWYAPPFTNRTERAGVTFNEFDQLWRTYYRGIAEYLGIVYEDRVEGDWINFTLTKK